MRGPAQLFLIQFAERQAVLADSQQPVHAADLFRESIPAGRNNSIRGMALSLVADFTSADGGAARGIPQTAVRRINS